MSDTLLIWRRDGDCITDTHLVRLGEEGWMLKGGKFYSVPGEGRGTQYRFERKV
jgi:hypothetical protein